MLKAAAAAAAAFAHCLLSRFIAGREYARAVVAFSLTAANMKLSLVR